MGLKAGSWQPCEGILVVPPREDIQLLGRVEAAAFRPDPAGEAPCPLPEAASLRGGAWWCSPTCHVGGLTGETWIFTGNFEFLNRKLKDLRQRQWLNFCCNFCDSERAN